MARLRQRSSAAASAGKRVMLRRAAPCCVTLRPAVFLRTSAFLVRCCRNSGGTCPCTPLRSLASQACAGTKCVPPRPCSAVGECPRSLLACLPAHRPTPAPACLARPYRHAAAPRLCAAAGGGVHAAAPDGLPGIPGRGVGRLPQASCLQQPRQLGGSLPAAGALPHAFGRDGAACQQQARCRTLCVSAFLGLYASGFPRHLPAADRRCGPACPAAAGR